MSQFSRNIDPSHGQDVYRNAGRSRQVPVTFAWLKNWNVSSNFSKIPQYLIGEKRKCRNKELHNYAKIIIQIKLIRMSWVEQVARMGERRDEVRTEF